MEHFVMIGVDKAQNNISFIRRYYYLDKVVRLVVRI